MTSKRQGRDEGGDQQGHGVVGRESPPSRRARSKERTDPSMTAGDPDANPDQAWKALGLVNDWIRHADAKTGATLAASGVIGTLLFDLLRNRRDLAVVVTLAATVCVLAVIASAGCAATALLPRLQLRRGSSEDPTSLLYFRHIATKYPVERGPEYEDVLRTLTSDVEALTRQIANQVHANAVTAHRKFVWADRVVRAMVIALAVLGVTACLIETL
jgi:hypothetical protein